MITGLHILLTYRCTSACDHCFLWCSPRTEGTFTRGGLESLLDQAVELGSIDSVHFEGGEPFLFHPLLVEGTRLARERGLEVGIVTNAYWATGVDEARLWLEPLAALGVADLSVSRDDFHGSPDRAAHAVAAARALGIDAGTITVEPPRTVTGDALTPADVGGPMMKGRAAERLIGSLRRHPADRFTACPHEDLRDPDRVHIDPFGHVHLCQGILMGTVGPRTLREVLEAHDPDAHPIAGPLLAGGPAELARRHRLPVDPAGYVDACHLCYTARAKLRDAFGDLLGPAQVYGE